MLPPNPEALLAGERRALARAITLVESSRIDHVTQAASLLDAARQSNRSAIRLGVSGTPGVGKSTFIEALGLHLLEQGLCLAVLAVDPSSQRSRGSILGDRTRMPELSSSERVYIRSSPSRGILGGLTASTADAVLLCEAAGYDVIIVETVGTGQSEGAISDTTDVFALMIAPAGGDELQGVKRGVMELADLIVVNKADGELKAAAERTAGDYRAALSLVRPKRQDLPTDVLTCSAVNGSGIAEVWNAIEGLWTTLCDDGSLDQLRSAQLVRSLRHTVTNTLVDRIMSDPAVIHATQSVEDDVANGQRSPLAAALEVLRVVDRLVP